MRYTKSTSTDVNCHTAEENPKLNYHDEEIPGYNGFIALPVEVFSDFPAFPAHGYPSEGASE